MILVCSQSTKGFLREEFDKVLVVNKAPDSSILELRKSESNVVAIGGGAVIDTAKIISDGPIICYPTTASGSALTSHSVYWDGMRKKGVKAYVPKEVRVVEEFIETLPDSVAECTAYDALSHCLDSSWSTKRTEESRDYVRRALPVITSFLYDTGETKTTKTELVAAGNLAGKAIEISPTTILHSLSYPMTGFFGMKHGDALRLFMVEACKLMKSIEWDFAPPRLSKVRGYYRAKRWYKDLGSKAFSHIIASEAMSYNKISNVWLPVNHSAIVEVVERSCGKWLK